MVIEMKKYKNQILNGVKGIILICLFLESSIIQIFFKGLLHIKKVTVRDATLLNFLSSLVFGIFLIIIYRKDLKKEMDKFIDSLKDIDVNEVKDEFLNKIEDIRNEIEDLDKEKVVKIAKEKCNDLKKKADELVELAKEKGTPIIESSADAVRQKAIDVTKSVLNKLEEN